MILSRVYRGIELELATDVARSLVESLPVDSTEVAWVGGGVRVSVYRCARKKSDRYRSEAVPVLTGGVQIIAMTDLPAYGPRTVHMSRVRPPWTLEMIERRLTTEIERILRQRALDEARDAVYTRMALVKKTPNFEREWLRHGKAAGLPLLIDVAEMTVEQARAWEEWLLGRS